MIRKVENLEDYCHSDDYDDKELKYKYFKLRLAHFNKKLFEQIFGHTFETLANKLINTTNKEENQIISTILIKIKTNLTKKKKQDLIM